MGGFYNGFEHVDELKNPCPSQESNPGSPSRSLVTTLSYTSPQKQVYKLQKIIKIFPNFLTNPLSGVLQSPYSFHIRS
jgi:hypothetical protein